MSTKQFLAYKNIIALCEKAQRLEVECGYAAHRTMLARNSYTVAPVFRGGATFEKAQRARAKAEKLVKKHWAWNEHATAFWVRHAPMHLVY
jgi:hypothetical protein